MESRNNDKTSKKQSSGSGQDRISQLCDELLHHILSSPTLTTMDVVRTCGISSRWRKLWSSMPCLSFNSRQYSRIDFERFVNAVLLLRDKLELREFRLVWTNCGDPNLVYTWVHYAVVHKVQILDLDVEVDINREEDREEELPMCLWTCQSLKELRLVCDVQIPGGSPRFAGLRSLHLGKLYHWDLWHEELISECPVLEDLSLEDCIIQVEEVEVCSNTLKNLSVRHCAILDLIRISTPSLLSLQFFDNSVGYLEVIMENLTSLTSASIQIDDDFIDCSFGGTNHDPFNYVGSKDKGPPSFDNLKNLTLVGTRMSDNFPVVKHFLEHSPNLEMLTIKKRELWLTPPDTSKETKLNFDHPHRKMLLRIECGDENEEVVDLVTKLFTSKCSCQSG